MNQQSVGTVKKIALHLCNALILNDKGGYISNEYLSPTLAFSSSTSNFTTQSRLISLAVWAVPWSPADSRSVMTRSPCNAANLREAEGDSRAFSKTEISAGSAVAQPSPPLDALHSSTRLRDASCWKENDHKKLKLWKVENNSTNTNNVPAVLSPWWCLHL